MISKLNELLLELHQNTNVEDSKKINRELPDVDEENEDVIDVMPSELLRLLQLCESLNAEANSATTQLLKKYNRIEMSELGTLLKTEVDVQLVNETRRLVEILENLLWCFLRIYCINKTGKCHEVLGIRRSGDSIVLVEQKDNLHQSIN